MVFRAFFLLLAALPILAGCRRPASPTELSPTPVPSVAASASPARVLLPDHLPLEDGVRADWGSPVEIVSYQTGDEARAQIDQSDLALVSQEIIAEKIASGVLSPIEDSLLPALHRPQNLFLHHYFDAQNRFSVPYAWSLLGVAYRHQALGAPVKNWKAIFSSGKPVAFLPENAQLLRLAAKIGLQPVPQTVAPDLADIQIGPVAALRRLPPEWTVALPAEGSYITLYSWVIPAGAKHSDHARAALVALFKPENLARFGTETHWGLTQKTARSLLPAEQAQDPLLYPPDPGRYLDLCNFLRP